jgi:hypothetical protein
VARQAKNVIGIPSEAAAVALGARCAIFVCIGGDKIGTRRAIEPAVEFGGELAGLRLPTPEFSKTVLCLPKRRFAR